MATKKLTSSRNVLRRAIPTAEEMEKIIENDNVNTYSSKTRSVNEKKSLQRYIGGDSSVSPMSTYFDNSDVMFF